jgi:hypothetical protein
MGRLDPEHHLHAFARLRRADLWRIDAEYRRLASGFNVAADNRHLGHDLHAGVSVGWGSGRER